LIDANLLLRTWLLTPAINGVQNPALAVLTNPTNIFAGHLPPGVDTSVEPAIVVRNGGGTASATGGGTAHPEIPIIRPRMQITAWCGPNQFQLARQLYGAIFDWMQGKTAIDLGAAGFVMSSLEETEGQDVTDPHTGFATVVSFWNLLLRA
jgi:hypothetical protein